MRAHDSFALQKQKAFDVRISIDFAHPGSTNISELPIGSLTEEDPECPCGLAIVLHSHGFGQVGPPGAEEITSLFGQML